MSFPWITVAQRRMQKSDEEFARRAVADLTYRLHCESPASGQITKSAPDTMEEILRRQAAVNVLRPARSYPLVVGRRGSGRSTIRLSTMDIKE